MKIKFDTEFLNRSKKFTFIFKNKKYVDNSFL